MSINRRAARRDDAVGRIERLVRPARAGHAGTLDPLATGVLVVCVGQATRLIQYIQRMPKTYRATFLLGQNSETDDIESELVPVDGATAPDRETLDRESCRNSSATSSSGRPPTRPSNSPAAAHINSPAAASKSNFNRGPSRFTTLPCCDTTTRSWNSTSNAAAALTSAPSARDLGDVLGTGAVMSALERTAIGAFRVEDARFAQTNIDRQHAPQQMQPALAAVADLPHVTLTAAQCLELRNGRPILTAWLTAKNAAVADAPELVAIDAAGHLVAILFEKSPGELWPPTTSSKPAGLKLTCWRK